MLSRSLVGGVGENVRARRGELVGIVGEVDRLRCADVVSPSWPCSVGGCCEEAALMRDYSPPRGVAVCSDGSPNAGPPERALHHAVMPASRCGTRLLSSASLVRLPRAPTCKSAACRRSLPRSDFRPAQGEGQSSTGRNSYRSNVRRGLTHCSLFSIPHLHPP